MPINADRKMKFCQNNELLFFTAINQEGTILLLAAGLSDTGDA
jgi:hypothetical protein